jgi:prepilin-type processing-associated H-X9-DG protein
VSWSRKLLSSDFSSIRTTASTNALAALLGPDPAGAGVHPRRPGARIVDIPAHNGGVAVGGQRDGPALFSGPNRVVGELARVRVDRRGQLMGFLYVDGHVRAYHGQRAISSDAYVARRHLAMPASTDYWINDRSGDPLLVVTGEVDAALTKALPRLLREVRDVVGERRVTIVFDRGGWSPKLFATMIKTALTC